MARHVESRDEIEAASPECYITTEEQAERLIASVRLLVFVFGNAAEHIYYDPDACEIYVFSASLSAITKLEALEEQRRAQTNATHTRHTDLEPGFEPGATPTSSA